MEDCLWICVLQLEEITMDEFDAARVASFGTVLSLQVLESAQTCCNAQSQRLAWGCQGFCCTVRSRYNDCTAPQQKCPNIEIVLL